MKKATRLTAFILALLTAFLMPFSAWAFTSKSIFTSSTYTHQDRYASYARSEGIDVSNHNGTVDWAKVKAAGVDFAIVRIGCRGYANAGTLMEDTLYKQNIEGAYKAGLKVGVYFYSQAITKAEAIEEANYVLNRIDNYKSKITLPVYFDYEFAPVSSGRLNKAWNNGSINKTKMTAYTKAFCNAVKNKGFKAGVYASKYFYYENLNYTDLEDKYDIWVAHYATKTDYKGDYSIWQFTAKGTIKGISGNVDSNFMYNPKVFDDTAIQRQAYTGSEIVPDFEVKYKGAPLRFGVDYYVTPRNNTNYGTASITVTGVNNYSGIQDKTYNFDIVPTAVTGAALVKREGVALTFEWEPHAEAEGYLVRYRTPITSWVNAGETTETKYRITGLKGATEYLVEALAIKTVNGKKYYGVDPEEQLKLITKPTKVKGIKTSARTKNSIKLKWTKQSGAKRYIVYRLNEETKEFEELGDTAKNYYLVEGLKTNRQYTFKVKAAGIIETGEEVFGAISSEYSDYTSPKTPKMKYAVSKKPYMIKANWTKVSGATGYQLMWSTSSKFTTNKKSVKVKTKPYTVKAARSGGSYYVRVRAYIKRGNKTYYSAWSTPKHLYTK